MAEQESLFDRLGGVYGIAGAVDVLVDRLYDNANANANPAVARFHAEKGHAGFKFLVTAWSVEKTGGPACYPGRDMTGAHVHLDVSEHDFDTVALEIASTLSYVGVPEQEQKEFNAIIESYRDQVVAEGKHGVREGSPGNVAGEGPGATGGPGAPGSASSSPGQPG